MDRFAAFAPSLIGPATTCFSVTPHDSNSLPETIRALFVGTGGSVTLATGDDAAVTFDNIADGTILPVRARAVLDTGTTAGGLVGLV